MENVEKIESEKKSPNKGKEPKRNSFIIKDIQIKQLI